MFRNQHHLGEREDVNTQMNVLSFSQQVNIFFAVLTILSCILTLELYLLIRSVLLFFLIHCHPVI